MHNPDVQPGTLLLIGGAEDKIGHRTILQRFVELAGVAQARIVVIATASSYEDSVGRRYVDLFAALGAARVELAPLSARVDACRSAVLEQLDDATAVFITGGDQLKLTAIIGGTPAETRLRQRHAAGCVIAGTSAGASVAAEHMMAYGASGIPPRKAMMQFAPGFGLIRGVIIDQHFGERGRAGRLITAVAHNPGLLGLGLDEDTAVEIRSDQTFTVLGRGAVLVVDAMPVSHNDIHRLPEQAPLSIFDLRVHTLASGYRFDLAERRPLLPLDTL
jgi:cyanophycinase